MSRRVLLLALCAGSLLSPTVRAQAPKPVKLDEAAVRAKLLAGPTIDAKVAKIDEAEGRLTLIYVHENKKPRPEGQKKLAAVQARFDAIANRQSTSLEEFNKAKAELEQAQKDAVTVEEVAVTLELKGDDKLAIRTFLVPAGPDGQPRKLTEAEKKKLKGDPRLPGNQAAWKNLEVGQLVRVHLDKPKQKAMPRTDDVPVYPITMIVIEPPPAAKEEMR